MKEVTYLANFSYLDEKKEVRFGWQEFQMIRLKFTDYEKAGKVLEKKMKKKVKDFEKLIKIHYLYLLP